MYRGYVKLWRKTKTAPVWQMPPLYQRVWDWIVMSVNFEEKSIPTPSGVLVINPGQRMTSLRQIADEVAWYEWGVLKTPNVKTIKEIINWFQGNGQLTVESNAKGTVLTVVNWDTYNTQDAEEVTPKEQQKVTARIQTPDTNKKEKKKDLKPSGENLLEICSAWKAFVEMRKFIKRPMTDFAMKLVVKSLSKLQQEGHDPTSVLNQSISHNWQTVYALKDEPANITPDTSLKTVVPDHVKETYERMKAAGEI